MSDTGRSMTPAQETSIRRLCDRYGVEFRESDYTPQFDLPPGYVAGWIGGVEAGRGSSHPSSSHPRTIYVGVDEDGTVSS